MNNSHELFLICLALGRQIVAETKAQYPCCESVVALSGAVDYVLGTDTGQEPKHTSEVARDLFTALQQHAPEAIKALAGTILPTAQSQLAANQAVMPAQAALEAENSAASNMRAAQSEAAIASGPGNDLVKTALAQQKLVDPNAFAAQDTVGAGLQAYLANQNGGRLNPSELEQISRGIARGSGAQLPASALTTLNNAMTFGSAGQARNAKFGEALTTAASIIPTLRSGINGFQVATTRQTPAAPQNIAQNAASQNFGFANNTLANLTSAENAQTAQRQTNDQISEGKIKSIMGIF